MLTFDTMRAIWTGRFCLLLLLAGVSSSVHGQTFVDNSIGLPRAFAGGTAVGDFDADGRLDLLCFDPADQWEAKLFRNHAVNDWRAVALPKVTNAHARGSCFWGDYNRDGKLDLLLSGSDASN